MSYLAGRDAHTFLSIIRQSVPEVVMGCQKSKIKAIHLAPGPEATVTTITKPNGGSDINSQSFRESDDMLPNRLLAAIPVSDLGDSLDSR